MSIHDQTNSTGPNSSARDSFEQAYQKAKAALFMAKTDEQRQEALNLYNDLLLEFSEHPRVYLAEIDVAKMGDGSPSSLKKGNDILERLLRRHDLETEAGVNIALELLDFRLRLGARTELMQLRDSEALVDNLLASGVDRTTKIKLVVFQLEIARYDKQPAAGIELARQKLIEELNWIEEGGIEELRDKKQRSEYMSAVRNLHWSMANVLAANPSKEAIEAATGVPQMAMDVDRDHLLNAIKSARQHLKSAEQSQESAEQESDFW